jgi:hypothetical protein
MAIRGVALFGRCSESCFPSQGNPRAGALPTARPLKLFLGAEAGKRAHRVAVSLKPALNSATQAQALLEGDCIFVGE